jgi:hypothetical protein
MSRADYNFILLLAGRQWWTENNIDWMEKVIEEQYNTKLSTKTNRYTETLASGLGQGVLDV